MQICQQAHQDSPVVVVVGADALTALVASVALLVGVADAARLQVAALFVKHF